MILEFLAILRVHFPVHPHPSHGIASVAAQGAPEIARRLMHLQMVAHLRFGHADKVAKDAAQKGSVDDVIRKRCRVTRVHFQQSRGRVRITADGARVGATESAAKSGRFTATTNYATYHNRSSSSSSSSSFYYHSCPGTSTLRLLRTIRRQRCNQLTRFLMVKGRLLKRSWRRDGSCLK